MVLVEGGVQWLFLAYDFLVQGRCVGYFSFCCDQVPVGATSRGKGFFWLTVRRDTAHDGGESVVAGTEGAGECSQRIVVSF